jgi:hypothetical protein
VKLLFPPFLFLTSISLVFGESRELRYAPAPPDNPLKGFVPYVEIDGWERFPHSLEFHYFALRDIMKGPDTFDWTPIEEKLAVTQSRGCQLVIRVMAEYPGRPSQIPDYLVEAGVKVTVWTSPEGDESHTPDYENPEMRKALVSVIEALGQKYDGDPRIGYFTAGLLGSWGEWHNYPRSDLWASHETQGMVLDAFEAAFEETPVLLRYPAGENHYDQAENASRPFGYHDDSFDWATLQTGREEDSWFFMSLLEKAGATEKWKTQPIGGEVRPELWMRSFTGDPHPKAQGFFECIKATHVTWLMDTGLFATKFDLPEERKAEGIRAAQAMGYEFHVASWERKGDGIRITVENRGVAPFYHNWPVELASGEEIISRFDLRGVLPGEEQVWEAKVAGDGPFRLRVPNPMEGGRPLRFANVEQGEEWLTLP